jgi:DNA helicase HerA-like ATPase
MRVCDVTVSALGPAGCAAYRITEIPRRPESSQAGPGRADGGDPGRPQRAAALVAAYHAAIAQPPGPVAFGWVRAAAGGPILIITAGDALVGSADADDGEVLLSLPGGARGRALPPGELAGALGQLDCWREIAGISDGLLALPGEDGGSGGAGAAGASGRAGLSLDEGLLGSWTGPFGWLVTAQPVTAAELRALSEEAGLRQRIAEGSADRFPERAAQARRLKERQAELQRGQSTGFWRITIAAGGRDGPSAARIAGLLCGSADLGGLPYALSPAPFGPGAALEPGGDAVPASPFYGSTQLLAALARPPESEVPGVRLALRPEFDVTQEPPAGCAPGEPASDGPADGPASDGRPGGRPGIGLGQILDRNLRAAGPFVLPRDSLNRHVFVCGATGAGKSQTVRSLLEAASGQGTPWLVVEPAKAEYRLMAARLPGAEVIRIRPGEPDAIAAGLNPLEPAVDRTGARFPLQTHADLVRALFIASFRSEEPFPQVLSAALGRVYEDAGWDLALGEPADGGHAAYPTLTALQRAAERVVTEIGYSQRVTDDVLGFIRVRLASLRHGTTGRFLEGGHPIDFGALLARNVVLEIEDVGDDADKAFLMGAVLIRLAEHLRLAHRVRADGGREETGGLRHLTVVEEAHRLLRRPESADGSGGGGAAGHAVEMFAGLLAEIRAYGEGLIIAEQIPARLVPDVIKNTAVKIVHRLPAADDREAVGATMNASPSQSRYLVTLPPGQAAVFSDGMDFPILVRVTDGSPREAGPPVPAADARAVVRPRSATCGAECRARPCTLRDMRAAQRALEGAGPMRAWAELAVLAHLTGWPAPVPQPTALATLTALPARVRQCALSHAVDAAVAVRAAAIADPAALAVHVCAGITARMDRAEWLCQPDEPQWLLAGAVTEEVAFGTARPSAIEAAGPLPVVLAGFIDCRWPERYLQAPGALRAGRDGRGRHAGGASARGRVRRQPDGSAAPAAGDAHPDQRGGGEEADGGRDPLALDELDLLEPRHPEDAPRLHVGDGGETEPDQDQDVESGRGVEREQGDDHDVVPGALERPEEDPGQAQRQRRADGREPGNAIGQPEEGEHGDADEQRQRQREDPAGDVVRPERPGQAEGPVEHLVEVVPGDLLAALGEHLDRGPAGDRVAHRRHAQPAAEQAGDSGGRAPHRPQRGDDEEHVRGFRAGRGREQGARRRAPGQRRPGPVRGEPQRGQAGQAERDREAVDVPAGHDLPQQQRVERPQQVGAQAHRGVVPQQPVEQQHHRAERERHEQLEPERDQRHRGAAELGRQPLLGRGDRPVVRQLVGPGVRAADGELVAEGDHRRGGEHVRAVAQHDHVAVDGVRLGVGGAGRRQEREDRDDDERDREQGPDRYPGAAGDREEAGPDADRADRGRPPREEQRRRPAEPERDPPGRRAARGVRHRRHHDGGPGDGHEEHHEKRNSDAGRRGPDEPSGSPAGAHDPVNHGVHSAGGYARFCQP